jgi:L-alanine-DL-glutamate epimerase-like enolase superfamily enzyme
MTIPENVTITRIDAAVLEGTRPRIIGRNSHIDVHGRVASDPVVRLHTDQGVTGWGWSRATADDAEFLAGKRLHEVFDAAHGTADDYLAFDFPLWDLAGRVLGRPVHGMLGDGGGNPVPVYDGTIYIDEVDAGTGRDDGLAPMLSAVRMGLDAGYHAFKVKVGRGFKWMENRAGMRRDIDVLYAIRDLIGPDMKLLIDANNGYTPAEARQVMREAGECGIYWFEEPFREDMYESVALRSFIREGGWDTLVADGEGSEAQDAEFTGIVRAGGIDVVQFDMRQYTLTRWMRYMTVIAETGALTAPHNFGSHLSGFYIPQFARGTAHFTTGETDIMTMPGVAADGYALVDGMRTVPDTPGFGLELDDAAFETARRERGGWMVESG